MRRWPDRGGSEWLNVVACTVSRTRAARSSGSGSVDAVCSNGLAGRDRQVGGIFDAAVDLRGLRCQHEGACGARAACALRGTAQIRWVRQAPVRSRRGRRLDHRLHVVFPLRLCLLAISLFRQPFFAGLRNRNNQECSLERYGYLYRTVQIFSPSAGTPGGCRCQAHLVLALPGQATQEMGARFADLIAKASPK